MDSNKTEGAWVVRGNGTKPGNLTGSQSIGDKDRDDAFARSTIGVFGCFTISYSVVVEWRELIDDELGEMIHLLV